MSKGQSLKGLVFNHTPGNWELAGQGTVYAVNQNGLNRFDAFVNPGLTDFKNIRISNKEHEANRSLISKAPKLLAALVTIIQADDENELTQTHIEIARKLVLSLAGIEP